jgi:hypothetical protein
VQVKVKFSLLPANKEIGNESDNYIDGDQWKQVDGGITVTIIIIGNTPILDIMETDGKEDFFQYLFYINRNIGNKIRYMFIQSGEIIQSL